MDCDFSACPLPRVLLFSPLRTMSRSSRACVSAALLMLSGGPAAAGVGPFFPAFGSNSASASSFVAGAHAGYNWQQGSMVYGFETDFQGMGLNSSMTGGLTSSSFPPSDYAHTCCNKVEMSRSVQS